MRGASEYTVCAMTLNRPGSQLETGARIGNVVHDYAVAIANVAYQCHGFLGLSRQGHARNLVMRSATHLLVDPMVLLP